MTTDKVKERLEQAREMEIIWNENDELTRMFLKGCIATANALAGASLKGDEYKKE